MKYDMTFPFASFTSDVTVPDEYADFLANPGNGLNGFFTDNIGIRGDVRYFRTLSETEADDAFDLALSDFDFWRATVGRTIRFGGN